jgi:hypothetical protein
MGSIELRYPDNWPEPEFSRLQESVFSSVSQPSCLLAEMLKKESVDSPVSPPQQPPMFRVAAYSGSDFVGWSCGWMERGRVFYMANSGVAESYRRLGIYTSMLGAIRKHAEENKAVAIRSHHSVLNNPILITKLRAGFHVSGLSQSGQMGTLVELTLHISEMRNDLYRTRSLPYVASDV